MKMKSFTDYLSEEHKSEEEIEAALKRALKLSGEPERGEDRKKVTVKKAPWDESTNEAVGDSAEALYALQDELGLEDNVLVDELARFLSADQIEEFVSDFRRNHDMNHPSEAVDTQGMDNELAEPAMSTSVDYLKKLAGI